MSRTGGQVLVDQLELHGVELVFGVPGESYLAVLDALIESPIRYVTTRHEVGAANMADAYGKLTGRPGVCMVTRGPGATHASGGVHTSYQDSTPLLLLIGQVTRGDMERDAFQEIDYRHMFGPMAKWVAQIDDASRIPELVARAFHVATSGRPGPVVLALPEDMLVDEVDVGDAVAYTASQAAPTSEELAAVRELLSGASAPLVVVGGAPWTAEAHDAVIAWAEASRLPVATGWRCEAHVDNTSRVYTGHLALGPDPRLAARAREADVLLAIGARLGDIETGGYAYLAVPTPEQQLVHVLPDPDELARVFQPALGIVASPAAFATALATLEPLDGSAWSARTEQARAEYLDNLRHVPRAGPGVDMGEVMAWLRSRLPEDATVTNGAGNFSVWAHRFYEFRRYGTQLAPQSGLMGYGLPAAIAAKLVHPERIVVCIAGDGDFSMTGQELGTAVQYGAPVVVLLVDNGILGTIRARQERLYPGRVSGTDLVNPDFAALARAYGAFAERVERAEAFASAFERALEAGVPALLHLIVDPEAISPRHTIAELREAALRARGAG
jgi:acetolactate synthase-1/2/3 large subunit